MGQELWIAGALMLVIEGVVPFLSPAAFRQALAMMAQMSDKSLRIGGLISMIVGVVVLYLVKE